MTSKLRDSLLPSEFRERYILRRILCENYMRDIPNNIIYNSIVPDNNYIKKILNRTYINNILKRKPDGFGYYDYIWKEFDKFTGLFDVINETHGTDIEYENRDLTIFQKKIIVSLSLGKILLLKIGFPDHFILGIVKRRGNTLYFTTMDPSGIDFNGRNIDYDSNHRGFQISFRRWIRENTNYNIYFNKPYVNICFQYNDYNCQTWVYYYIHIVYIDTVSRKGLWKKWLNILKGIEDGVNKFEVEITLNLLLEEFIYFMTIKEMSLFIKKFPFHFKLLSIS